jgi:hypothetical protein
MLLCKTSKYTVKLIIIGKSISHTQSFQISHTWYPVLYQQQVIYKAVDLPPFHNGSIISVHFWLIQDKMNRMNFMYEDTMVTEL